jgi:hypothetical protein
MFLFSKKPTYSLKVGHDRYGNLIIKELGVKGNNLDEVMAGLTSALEQFNEMKGQQIIEGKI